MSEEKVTSPQGRMFSNPVLEKAWNLWAHPQAYMYVFEGKYRIKCPVCEKVLENESDAKLIKQAISHANEHLLCLLIAYESVR